MKLKKLVFLVTLFISGIAFGQKGNLSPIFDISPDNKSLVVSLGQGPISNLYIFSLADNKLTPLTDEKDYYARPVFSPKGDKVIFLSKDLEAETSVLCSIDLASKKITKLTETKKYITEAAFMPNGNEIIYCASGIITNYSPLARKAPHDIDLYLIGVNGGTPSYSGNNSHISFTAPYQVYIMNMADKKCEEIWSAFGDEKQAMPIFTKFDGTGQKVYFAVLPIVNRQYARNAQFYYYDLSTKKVTPVSIAN